MTMTVRTTAVWLKWHFLMKATAKWNETRGKGGCAPCNGRTSVMRRSPPPQWTGVACLSHDSLHSLHPPGKTRNNKRKVQGTRCKRVRNYTSAHRHPAKVSCPTQTSVRNRKCFPFYQNIFVRISTNLAARKSDVLQCFPHGHCLPI